MPGSGWGRRNFGATATVPATPAAAPAAAPIRKLLLRPLPRNLRRSIYFASSFIARSRPFSVVGYMRPFISSFTMPIDWR